VEAGLILATCQLRPIPAASLPLYTKR
jgi:hypothetical protein